MRSKEVKEADNEEEVKKENWRDAKGETWTSGDGDGIHFVKILLFFSLFNLKVAGTSWLLSTHRIEKKKEKKV